MTEFQMKLLTIGVVAVLTILYVYAPWRSKKKCHSCGAKVERDANQCPNCHTAL